MRRTTTPRRTSRPRSVPRRAAAATAGAAALLAAAPATAGAGQPDVAHFKGTFAVVLQDDGLCTEVPFPVRQVTDFNVHFMVSTDRNGLPTVSVNWSNRGTYENLDTGESYDYLIVNTERESKLTENGDGTVSLEWAGHVTAVVHTPTGGLYGIDSQYVTAEFVADLKGTPDIDDDELLSAEFGDPVGVSTMGGFDECAVAVDQLG